jgi:hypothetical protein
MQSLPKFFCLRLSLCFFTLLCLCLLGRTRSASTQRISCGLADVSIIFRVFNPMCTLIYKKFINPCYSSSLCEVSWCDLALLSANPNDVGSRAACAGFASCLRRYPRRNLTGQAIREQERYMAFSWLSRFSSIFKLHKESSFLLDGVNLQAG